QAAFFAALTFAHLARCAAAILFRAAGDSVRFFEVVGLLCAFPFTLAHRALCAAAIRSLAAAESVLVPVCLLPAPSSAASAASNCATCLAALSRSFFNCWITAII